MATASWWADAEQYNIMLDAVRRWLGRDVSAARWAELSAWADERGWTLKRPLARDGWVLRGEAERAAWRIEWGPAQRGYMGRRELRVRIDLPEAPDVQALVLDRPLLARLDKDVFAQFTGRVQTRFDDETPEEMRWLAMHPKLSPNQMGAALRDRYGALGSDAAWVSAWLDGSLADALKRRADAVPFDTVPDAPFVLRLARGQLVLRQAAKSPGAALLETCLDVAAAAAQSATARRA